MNHSIDDLRYRLVAGPVDLRPLRILACRSLAWRGWRVTVRILGASHAVTLERNGARLTELLTCAIAAGSPSPTLELTSDTASGSAEVCGVACGVRLTRFSLSPDAGLILDHAPDDQLYVAFPSQSGEAAAVTRVGWRVCECALHVETIHTYPESATGIRSESLFSLLEEQ